MGLRCFLQTQEKNLIFVYIDVFWFGRDTKKNAPKNLGAFYNSLALNIA
jgi:hypothetical protein